MSIVDKGNLGFQKMRAPAIETASKAIKAMVDFLVPVVCVHCGAEGSLWCDQCIVNAPKLAGNTCLKCGERTSENLQLCGDCIALPPPLDRLVPIFRYGGPVRSAVHALKYRHIIAIAPEMAKTMSAHSFATRANLDCVAPVPAHTDRLRERGYNQTSLLAKEIACNLQLRFLDDALTKTRATQSQVELTRHQRAVSLIGAFEANYRFDDAHVLLIDDVCTTGNTLMNCAAALKRAGARRVSAIVFAKEKVESEFDNEE